MSWPNSNIDQGDSVSANLTPGWTRVSGIGFNPQVDTASVPQDAWGGAGLYPWLAAASQLEVVGGVNDVNLTGTGAWKVLVAGLDANYNPISAVVALNGTTPVQLPVLFYRINGIRCTEANRAGLGTNGANLTVRDTGGGTVRGIILAGKGVARQAPYTVPAGFTLFVKQIFINADSTTGAINKFARIETYFAAPAPSAIFIPLTIGNTNATPYNHTISPPITVQEKNDFALRIALVSDNATIVSTAWNGVLRRNN